MITGQRTEGVFHDAGVGDVGMAQAAVRRRT